MDEKPFIIFAKNLFQNRVHFTFICLSLDSAELEKRYRQGKEQSVVEKIQDAVDAAHSRGAEVVSLGGYTSILTGNGLAIREPPGTRVITGNTLTAAAGVESLLRAISESSLLGDNLHLGIVGAAGNIGSVVALALARHREFFSRLTLVVRQTSAIGRDSLETLKKSAAAAGIQISITSEMDRLKDCDVISIATNTNDPLVFPHHLNQKKRVYISDLSVPSAVAKAARDMENVRLLKFASFVTLPYDKDLVISSHTPPGTAFCCAAEALVCGLESVDLNLRGSIDLESVDKMTKLANKYGLFDRVGELDSFKTNE